MNTKKVHKKTSVVRAGPMCREKKKRFQGMVGIEAICEGGS